MPWVRIDEEFPRHPKVVKAGPLGMAMHVAALCYCNQYLTDGFVPKGVAAGLLDLSGIGMRQWMGELVGGGVDATWELIVEDLEKAGLWERVEGGWQIHDYHDYQPSREHVLKVREVRQDAGRKGGQARGKQAPKQVAKQSPSNRQAKTEAESKPVPGPVPPVGDPGVQVIPDAETSGLPTVAALQIARLESQDTIDAFEAWKATLPPGSRPRLTPARRDAIRAALRRYNKDDVLDAARGWPNDPWPERAQQNDLAQLLHMGSKRKPANILERMRDYARNGRPVVLGKQTAQMLSTHQALQHWAEQTEGGGGDDPHRVGPDRGQAQRELPGSAG